jgi:hypothetical protein
MPSSSSTTTAQETVESATATIAEVNLTATTLPVDVATTADMTAKLASNLATATAAATAVATAITAGTAAAVATVTTASAIPAKRRTRIQGKKGA